MMKARALGVREITRAEKARLSLPAVPFYVYDGDSIPGFRLDQMLEGVEGCLLSRGKQKASTTGMQHYMGEYLFLRSLLGHRWRVHAPQDAAVLVLPLLLSMELRGICATSFNGTAIRRAILSHVLFSTRRSASYPTPPRTCPSSHALRRVHDSQNVVQHLGRYCGF